MRPWLVVSIPLLALSPAISLSVFSTSGALGQETLPTKQKASKHPEPSWPTYELFRSSRMFTAFFPDLEEIDLAKTSDELKQMAEIQRQAKGAGESEGGGLPGDVSALLEPRVEEPLSSAFMFVPIVFMKLEPLWKADAWSKDQLALAQAGLAILSTFPDLPKVAFQEGKNDGNRKALKELVRWFGVQSSKPERLAAMIPTMDYGPFAGLPYETKELLPPSGTQKLGEEMEIRLCRVERPKEPWVMQMVRGKELLWSRVVSGGPDESVREAELVGEPKALGVYGWKVHLRVRWSQGDEQGIVYVDSRGKLLFYYLSW